MATVKKSKKKVIAIVCVLLAIVVAVTSIVVVTKAKSGTEVSLHTIAAEDIIETVSLTGTVSAGTTKEYKVGTVATVKEVFVKVGDNVKKGDVLATFDVSNLDGQINALQSSYNESLKAYNSAVDAQKTAKSKSDALAPKITELQKLIAEMEKGKYPSTAAKITKTAKTTTAKAPNTTKTVSENADFSANAVPTLPDDLNPSIPDIELTTSSQPTLGSLADAVEELNRTLTKLTNDIATLTQTTQIIATTTVSYTHLRAHETGT